MMFNSKIGSISIEFYGGISNNVSNLKIADTQINTYNDLTCLFSYLVLNSNYLK